jgi:hypothetical protein
MSSRLSVLLVWWSLACQLGCADSQRIEPPLAGSIQHRVTFVGYVYDGASGKRLTGYGIELQVVSDKIAGSVAGDGRFSVGDIGAFDDYTVIIKLDGYRAFMSHNARVGLGASDTADQNTRETRHFDAFLFPTKLQTAPVSFTVKSDLPDPKPSGTLRLRPTTQSLIADGGENQPVGVAGQTWANDEDLQAAVVTKDFSNGSVDLMQGELVYGVKYRVDIFGVAQHQPFTGSYTAGVEGSKTFKLTEEITDPLAVVTTTHKACKPPMSPNESSGAGVTITFNYSIELGETGYPGGAQEALDDGLSISSPDKNSNNNTNKLRPDNDSKAQERATNLSYSANQITIGWSPTAGLIEKDDGDPINSVTYGNLSEITIRRVGSPSSTKALSTLLGMGSITCSN